LLQGQLGIARPQLVADGSEHERRDLPCAVELHGQVPKRRGAIVILRLVHHGEGQHAERLLGIALTHLQRLDHGVVLFHLEGDLALDVLVDEPLLDLLGHHEPGDADARGEASDVGPVGHSDLDVQLAGQQPHPHLRCEPQRNHQPRRGPERSADQQEEIEELDLRFSKKDQEGAHDSGDRAGRADHRHRGVGDGEDVEERSDETGHYIEPEIDRPAPPVLDERPGQEQDEHVAQQVQPARVEEHVADPAQDALVRRYQAPLAQRVASEVLDGPRRQGVEVFLFG
jgi:hypothetical protein